MTCEHRRRRVTRTLYMTGTITVLADTYQGKRLNAPNDIVVKSGGTDPTYGISAAYEGGKAESEIGSATSIVSIRETARCASLPTTERPRLLARRKATLHRGSRLLAESRLAPPYPRLRGGGRASSEKIE